MKYDIIFKKLVYKIKESRDIMDIFANVYFYVAFIVLIILVILFAIFRNKAISARNQNTLQAPLLVEYLGGSTNIESIKGSMSKISVLVHNPALVDVAAIKGLGASGVVETNKGFTFIFGQSSQTIADDINNMLSAKK